MKDMLSIKNTEMCQWRSREGNITRVWMKNLEKNRKIPFINGIYDFKLLDGKRQVGGVFSSKETA